MSSENVEIIKRWYEKPSPEFLDENVDWIVTDGYPAGGSYQGRDAVFGEFFPKLRAHFDKWNAKPDEFLDAGESVVMIGSYVGVAKGGTETFSIPCVNIWWLKNGKIVKARGYAETLKLNEVIKGVKE